MIKNKICGFDQDKLKQWFLYWMAIGVGFFILIFLVTSTWIGVDVRERCLVARGRYEGDCVEALIQVVDGDINSFHERNSSIWALGQIGDDRAKEVIEKYYTGIVPQRESYDGGLSQYEMKKALQLLDGGFNATHLVWNPEKVSL